MNEKSRFLIAMSIFITVLLIVFASGLLAAEAKRWKDRVDYAATLQRIEYEGMIALYDPKTGEIIASTEGVNDE
jgi:gamma-glutamyltranspeptidase